MADVLSQSEVESLLSALGAEDETDDFSSRSNATSARLDSEITPYDFKRPERVSKEQIQAFQALHDGFSREFGATLSGLLRTIVEVKLISVDQLTYSEFVFSLENPTCFNLLEASGLNGHIILDLNPSIIFPIVDRMLGGGREAQQSYPNRPLTEIESKLVSRITSLAIAGLEKAWSNICDLKLRVTQIESNPQLIQIVPPNEVVVLISFELTMGEARGIINLCIPFNTIEPLSGKLASDTWSTYTKREVEPRQKVHLETGLSSAAVEMVAILAESQLTAHEVTNLAIGDIIMTDHLVSKGIQLLVEDRPMFEGQVGMLRGRKAIRLGKKIAHVNEVIEKRLASIEPPVDTPSTVTAQPSLV